MKLPYTLRQVILMSLLMKWRCVIFARDDFHQGRISPCQQVSKPSDKKGDDSSNFELTHCWMAAFTKE